jgi:hypothetical protein
MVIVLCRSRLQGKGEGHEDLGIPQELKTLDNQLWKSLVSFGSSGILTYASEFIIRHEKCHRTKSRIICQTISWLNGEQRAVGLLRL